MHKIDLSGQQLTAGDDFVCVAVTDNMCVCIRVHLPITVLRVCVCVSLTAAVGTLLVSFG